MTLHIDPLGFALLRELVEAWEAAQIIRKRMEEIKLADSYYLYGWILTKQEYHVRNIDYEALLADFLEHLTYMPCEAIDVSHYAALWAHYQTISENERNMGRLFDIAQDIGLKAIELYTAR